MNRKNRQRKRFNQLNRKEELRWKRRIECAKRSGLFDEIINRVALNAVKDEEGHCIDCGAECDINRFTKKPFKRCLECHEKFVEKNSNKPDYVDSDAMRAYKLFKANRDYEVPDWLNEEEGLY
jgi:hypothetical protein